MEHTITIRPCWVSDTKGDVVIEHALTASCTCGWYANEQEFLSAITDVASHLSDSFRPRKPPRCDQCGALPGECTDDYGNTIGSCYKPTQLPRYMP